MQESLPQRIRAGCDRLGLAYDFDAELCHSAFVRVATPTRSCDFAASDLCHSAFVRVATMRPCATARHARFATAHSCGLRRIRNVKIVDLWAFATAHSCGLRQKASRSTSGTQSLPQRIRAGCDHSNAGARIIARLCHSAFVRVATRLPDGGRQKNELCHSAFVRVATQLFCSAVPMRPLCHSAFVRVATVYRVCCRYCAIFATAHSCGLRPYLASLFASKNSLFATAHSCGLRLRKSNAAHCEFAARR